MGIKSLRNYVSKHKLNVQQQVTKQLTQGLGVRTWTMCFLFHILHLGNCILCEILQDTPLSLNSFNSPAFIADIGLQMTKCPHKRRGV